MNSFNFNRFCQTLRWVIANDFRSLAAWTVGYAACIFLAEMLILAINNWGSYYDVLRHSVADFPMVFIIIAILIGLSMIFLSYGKKAKREALLMLPATNLEKFLSAMLYVTVVWTLAVFLSFVVGDTLRMVVRAVMYNNEWISTVPMVLEGLMPDAFDSHSWAVEPTHFTIAKIFCAVSMITWVHSLYTLCGTLMRKYAFVVATVVALSSCIFTLWVAFDKLHIELFYGTVHNGELVYEIGPMGCFLCVILPLLTVFNHWASFRIFKGFQLITNKWINYDILKR